MTRSESEPMDNADDPSSSAAQFRAHMEDLENQHEVLHERFERARSELGKSRERVKLRLQALRQEMSRSHKLSDALRAAQLKSMCGNGPATPEEYGRRQELALVANHMSDALLLMAVEPQGVFRTIFANPAANHLLSSFADRDVWSPDILTGWMERLQQIMESRASLQFEAVGPDPGIVLEIRLEPVLGSLGECNYVLNLIRDISERKRAEQAMEEARAAAERANQAKDRFLAVLSHELRTPLTPVLATACMLGSDPRLDSDLREHMEMIRRNIELEARLIEDLLDVTRISRGKIELRREILSCRDVLQRAIDICRPEIEAQNLRLITDFTEQPVGRVHADAARLQQVFWNLLKNAVKFTPPGGRIHVLCRTGRPGTVTVEIQDTGVGIPPEAISRIFEAFEQGERAITRRFGGLGLGLSISKALVDLHGGSIQAQSAGHGQGATFTVQLPTFAEPPNTHVLGAPGPQAHERRHAENASPLRILLVEDHGDTARVLNRLLARRGFDVQTAGNVATALVMAVPGSFDLLISDLGLPDRSGIELIQELRATGQALPAIALSGYGHDRDIALSRQAGFNAHLVKPLNFEELYRTIADVTREPTPGTDIIPASKDT